MIDNVSRETTERLDQFQELLLRWNKRINLVSTSTVAQFRERHINDCLQIARHASPNSGVWADFGSGGGLPGLVLAIAFERDPVELFLIEGDSRKAAFLRTAARELGLKNVQVLNRRIENILPLAATNISARAFAPLSRMMPDLVRHLAPTGQAWLLKGVQWNEEVEVAKKHWRFNLNAIPSQVESGAALLNMSEIRHV